MAAHRIGEPRDLDQVQVDPEPRQRGQPLVRSLGFVVERQRSLCHSSFTPLVMW